jgi:hypothetical protein
MGEAKRRREEAEARARADWEASGKKLGDAPIEAEYHTQMTAVMQVLDELFNGKVGGPDRKVGFVLMVFPYGDSSGRCNYASNGADRRDIVTLMKEMIRRFEGEAEPNPGRA